MSFFNYVEQKLSKASPRKLPEPKLDDEAFNQFVRLRIRFSPIDEDESLPSELFHGRSFRDDRAVTQPPEGLVKVSAEIFHYRFLSCFEQLTDGSGSTHGRIIITDPSSWSMVERAVDWLTLKRSGVSCVFQLEDTISNELTRTLQVIYLINIVHLTNREFELFMFNMAARECRSCCVFLTYLVDPYLIGSRSSTRLKYLNEIIIQKSMVSPWIVGAFHAVSPWLALIDLQCNLKYLRQLTVIPRTSQKNQSNRLTCCRLAFRLVNLFEQMNQFPIVRYMNTWHSHNKLIANLFFRGMNGLREKRQSSERGRSGSSDKLKYGSDYTLVIIDRSVDLLTPILHADHYEAFVEQELETQFPRSTDHLDSQLRNCHINEVAFKLKTISESLKSTYDLMSVKDQEDTMNFVKSHLEIITRLTAKINSGYRVLLKMEQKALKKLNEKLEKRELKQSRQPKDTDSYRDTVDSHFGPGIVNPDVSPFDLHRLVLVRSLVQRKLIGSKYLRSLLGPERFHWKDSLTISKYADLIRTCSAKSESYQFGFPVIANIIELFYSDSLSEGKFPFVETWMRNKSPRKKLCIFVLGGISYNELQLSGVFTSPNQDITLISDNLLTANDIILKLFH